MEALVKEGIFSATKYCMTLQGIDAGPCRKPFDRLTQDQKVRVQEAFKKMEQYL
ncbi:MAG: hypothetical protein WCR13_05350 [Sphaerochaeta sp.]